MMTETNFLGTATRLSDSDLPRIGKTMLGCGEDEIHAVLEVETSGHGFDSKGRPIILFEPHVFYRNLKNSGVAFALTNAVDKGLAYPRWGEKPYPKDSYPRLIEAIAIDETAALKSCSWGLGQILGENFKLAGYATVQAMVRDMTLGEAEQLTAMATFIKSNKLDGHLRSHDWAAFARGYNGAGYAKNHYDTRLAAAFAKWQKIPDTDWRTDASIETRVNPPEAPPTVEHHDVQVPPAPTPPTAPKSAVGISAVAVSLAAYFHDHWWVVPVAIAVVAAAVFFGFRSKE